MLVMVILGHNNSKQARKSMLSYRFSVVTYFRIKLSGQLSFTRACEYKAGAVELAMHFHTQDHHGKHGSKLLRDDR